MLLTFKSKAAANVLMLDDLAGQLFQIMGHELSERGILTPEALPQAIASLEAAVVADNARSADEGDEAGLDETARQVRLRLAQRAFPFLDLLRAAQRRGHSVVWGV